MTLKGTCEALRLDDSRQGILYISPGKGERTLLIACCGDELEAMLPDIERMLMPQIGKTLSPFASIRILSGSIEPSANTAAAAQEYPGISVSTGGT